MYPRLRNNVIALAFVAAFLASLLVCYLPS
jgi:hypothetical protein